jgi:isopentenyl-diphosphate delta-isomerase
MAPSDAIWGEHEIDYILFYRGNVELAINPNEVKSVKYVTKQELKEMLSNKDELGIKITPWFKLIAEKFLYIWWDNLDDISKYHQHDTIHRL